MPEEMKNRMGCETRAKTESDFDAGTLCETEKGSSRKDANSTDRFSTLMWYTVYLDVEKSKFFGPNYALLEGDVVAVSVQSDDAVDKSTINSQVCESSSFDWFLKKGSMCFVAVRKEIPALHHALIPENIARERQGIRPTLSTGWMRHELYGLVAKVKIPIGGPGFDASKLNVNKGGIRCLDFQGEFQGIWDLQDENERNMSNNGFASFASYSAQNDDILTIKQSDLQDRLTRHCHFAKWLVDTFGRETLSRGSGVLDVAGGNGKLGKALTKLGVHCTILDPQPTCQESPGIRIIAEPLKEAGQHLTSPNHPQSEIVRDCSIIVGLHPDQATEAVVDMAMRLEKPFAVSPCCVMKKLFPHRRQKKSGDPVTTVWALCRYLLDKAPTDEPFEVDFLPFAGRNKVIFSRNTSPDASRFICREIA